MRTTANAHLQSANSDEIAPTWLKMTLTKSVSDVFTQPRPSPAFHQRRLLGSPV